MTATACTQIPTARSLAKPDFSQWEFVCRLLGVISLTTSTLGLKFVEHSRTQQRKVDLLNGCF